MDTSDPFETVRHRLKQVFQYLKAVNELRTPIVRQLNEQPWAFRLADLPGHPCIGKGEESVFSVRKPTLTPCPTPPAEILDWLKDGWQNIDAAVDYFATREGLAAVADIAVASASENGQQTQAPLAPPKEQFDLFEAGPPLPTTAAPAIKFEDDPKRPEAFAAWHGARAQWAQNEKPARQAQSIFERLFALHSQLEREAENFELVLGDGFFNWRLPSGSLHHPILLKGLELRFDPVTPQFDVVENDAAVELYTGLFSGEEFAAKRLDLWREEIEKGDLHPLGGDDVTGWLRGIVGSFPDGEYVGREPGGERGHPRIGRNPAIFLRKRNLGYAAAVAQVLGHIDQAQGFPAALQNIVGFDASVARDDADSLPGDVYANEDETTLLSKPANAQQLQIIRRLEQQHAVLVQGPPGTGKTHTIANIIGHLLAQGQSILVTSHTTKALRVLRGQVVEALQPLCVSVLDSDLASRGQLEIAVDAISGRLDSLDAKQLAREGEQLAGQRASLLAQLRVARQALQDAVANEYRDLVLGDESIAPSQAARLVAAGAAQHAWLPPGLAPGAALPLSEAEVCTLYASNGQLCGDDERGLSVPLPELASLWPPGRFSVACAELGQFDATALALRRDLWRDAEANLPPGLPEQLAQAADKLPKTADETWRLAVIEAGINGKVARQVWESLCTDIEQVWGLANAAHANLIRHGPQLSADHALEQQIGTLQKIVLHLEQGKSLGIFQLGWRRYIKSLRIDSGEPTQLVHFQALRDAALLQMERDTLRKRWDRQMAALGAPAAGQFGTALETQCAQYVILIRQCLDWHAREWLPLQQGLIHAGLRWEALALEQQPVLSAYPQVARLQSLIQDSLLPAVRAQSLRQSQRQLANAFGDYAGQLDNQLGNGPSVALRQLLDAVENRDPNGYAQAYARLEQLWQLFPVATARQRLIGVLSAVAPRWAESIGRRQPPHDQAEPPGDAAAAWRWRQFQEELQRRGGPSVAALQQEIESLVTQLQAVTTELIDKRAWQAQLDKINAAPRRQRQALMEWLATMKKMGAGAGKKVPLLRREARKLMAECRKSVPVWIMPFSRVVDSFNPGERMFDVLVIDEASQLDISGLLAFYLAERVIIVGDHEQVSPLSVGTNQNQIDGLIGAYLRGIPSAHLYDLKSSVYDKARQAFTSIRLVEHFRCVPEIIQFSNHLSYHGKVKPLRESSSTPVRPALVAYRVDGARDGDKNLAEARAIASLIKAAIEQPEYAGKTFGAITLLSKVAQAETIDKLLRQTLDPVEYEARRIVCGVPAQFQGDERDVVFLSMVDSLQAGGALRLKQDDRYQKRYNVAASRAKDQLWVVHSLDHEADLKPGDLRRRLIEHALDPNALLAGLDDAPAQPQAEFAAQVMQRLVAAGYRVVPQWQAGAYRIGLVVAGGGGKLAIECDGDRWHPVEQIPEDMAQQAILERLGWKFLRLRGSEFFRAPEAAMQPVFKRLDALQIPPEGNQPTAPLLDRGLLDRALRRAAELLGEFDAPTDGGGEGDVDMA